MAFKDLPSPEVLRQLLRYEPETGKLFWKERGVEWFKDGKKPAVHSMRAWNGKNAGKEAFTASSAPDYKQGRIFDQAMLAHRVIWAMVYSEWPVDFVDHRNMDRQDNRIENLRAATARQNGCNRKPKAGTTSPFLGVSWNADCRKWAAFFCVNKKTFSLGLFQSETDAALAYDAAAIKHHGEFARPNFPRLG